MGLMIFMCFTILFATSKLVLGHGNMVRPMAWWDENHVGSYWDETGKAIGMGCGVLDLPSDTEYMESGRGLHDCMQNWLSHNVKIPGTKTLPDYMNQTEVTCVGQNGAKPDHPWNAPGTAPVFGPCGSMGGMPFGCDNDGGDSFGDCCSANCDMFAKGNNSESYEWPSMPITEWQSGSFQEVAWFGGANHAGGYSYRLCKMPEGGISQVTEECFQQNPMEFVGDMQWVVYQKDKDTGVRTEVIPLQTTEGTYPERSMWRAHPLYPPNEEGGSMDYGQGEVIDYVRVPTSLEPGQYVVSFR